MLAVIDQGQDTRLFVVHTHHDSNYHFLGQKYPLLKKMDPHQEGIVSFFDGNDKAVIVINVNDISGLDKACSLLAQAGEIKAGHLFTPLN